MNLLTTIKNNKWQFIILAIVIIAAFLIRIKGLGKWPLAIDEYYVVKSSENILKNGFPEWTFGNYYLRGLAYQYLISGLLLLGLKAEFAARIITVFVNLLAIPPIYILTKKISNKLIASVLVIIFCFSLWEIEFARFARMYVPFQTIFVWYILFLYKYLIEGNRKSLIWLFALSFFSIFVYEGSVFLALLNFLILFWDQDKKAFISFKFLSKVSGLFYLLIDIFIFISAYFYESFGNRNTRPAELFPKEYLSAQSHQSTHQILRLPDILLSTIANNGSWLVPLTIILLLNIIGLIFLLKAKSFEPVKKIIALLFILLSVLNQFGLLVLLLLVFIAANQFNIADLKRRELRLLVISVLINFFFWFAYSFYTTGWYKFFPDFEAGSNLAIVKKIFLLLFNYPDNYIMIYIYITAIPIVTLLFFFSLAVLTLYIIRKSYYNSLNIRFVYLILLLMTTAATLINTTLGVTRYTFFLYPVVLISIVLAFKIISDIIFNKPVLQKTGFAAIALIAFFLSDDFGINHMIQIDSKEYNFRTVLRSDLVRHYFQRADVRTPAEIINKKASANDIIIINELNMAYYLNRLDYAYIKY